MDAHAVSGRNGLVGVWGRCWGGGRPGDAGSSQMSEANFDFDADSLEDELKPLDLDDI